MEYIKHYTIMPPAINSGELPYVIFGRRPMFKEPMNGLLLGSPDEIYMSWKRVIENDPTSLQPKMSMWGECFISLDYCKEVFEKLAALECPSKMDIDAFTKILDECGFKGETFIEQRKS